MFKILTYATLQEYDTVGRESDSWLPISISGSYLAPTTFKSNAPGNYGSDARPYSQKVYESSPLDRLTESYRPGNAWSTKPAKVEYAVNTTDSPLNCIRYSVSSADALVNNGNYAKGTLRLTKSTDEDDKVRYTFTDKQGQKLLERSVNGSEYLDTYYVYDDYGCLRFVLQPEYQTTADLSKYAFQYKYDSHNNCIWKKLPGAAYVTYEYDAADRMIFSQDGVQRASGKWTFYVYDSLGRLTQQGENTSKAIASSGVYLQNYYDNYTSLRSAVGSNSNYPDDTSGNSRGFLTGTMAKVLGTDTKLYTAFYYDIEGKVTKKVQQNMLGGHDITTTTYSFSGKPLTVTHAHTAPGKTARTEVLTYTYDEKDRVSVVKHKLGSAEVTLASYTYDTFGRMATRKLHGSGTNQLNYSYNIQNWLTGISSGKFSQALTYNNGTTGFNGNISSMNWNANGASHSYTFTYDGANRMLNATHGTGAYTEKVTSYDKNGNIKALQRYGNGLIDNLTYTYNGNQLTRVDDATGNAAGFSNGASAANEYTYDNNGNLTKDSNKNISSIAYNCLNLPSNVTFSDGSTIVYSYAADGTKLRTVHVINGTTIQKDYCANVVYENGVQKLLLTEEGYVDLSASTPTYYYYLKDHQGNNRVVINSSGTVQETNHYYPFGSVFASTGNVQPYKYNGKELDTKKGLNWYDYGARHYDATLGRWFVVDPLAEKMSAWSPYAYCFNNPIRLVDCAGTIPTLYEAALIAKHVYGDKVDLTGGWKVSDITFDNMNSENGLKSAIYERTVDDVTEYVYATAGTDLLTIDMWEDIAQLWGQANQYGESVTIAKAISNDFPNSELTFVGHSLGGGLAAANALATDKNAITFNPAALSSATKKNLGLKPLNKGNITNVIISGELISFWQSIAKMSYEGDIYTLNASYLSLKGDISILINTIRQIRNHLIGTVIDKLKEKKDE